MTTQLKKYRVGRLFSYTRMYFNTTFGLTQNTNIFTYFVFLSICSLIYAFIWVLFYIRHNIKFGHFL